jgi:minor histocompatibility antigen H13
MPKMLEENPTMLIALGFMITAATGIILTAANRVRAATIHALQQKAAVRTENTESLSLKQAMLFPVTGSVTLFSLYMIIKYLPKEWFIHALVGYLTLASVGALAALVKPRLGASIPIGAACCGISLVYLFTRNWVLNNVIAFAICVVALELVHLNSFATGAMLLSGLFFYDIFWVFGTDVMVTVAINIDGPIKLLFPQNILSDDWTKKSLLGLGDIVIPGFFLLQVLRMCLLRSKGRDEFYFWVGIAAYVASLVNTMFVMVVFEHAQPALLYIVPYLLAATMGAAWLRGELGQVFWFDQDAFEASRLGTVTENEANRASLSPKTQTPPPAEEEMSAWEEIKQAALSVFGQDDAYLEEIGIQKKKTAKK